MYALGETPVQAHSRMENPVMTSSPELSGPRHAVHEEVLDFGNSDDTDVITKRQLVILKDRIDH
jgi:hypothetical protein